MINALVLSFEALAEPAIRRLLLRCILAGLITFAALLVIVAALLGHADPTGIAWLDPVIAVAGSTAVAVLAWFLFPIFVTILLGLFADQVVDAVEQKHYPDLPPAKGLNPTRSLLAGIRFAAFALVLNILALPLYLLPGANLLVYLGLNGYLLGREYFELVALRRLTLAEARRQRRRVLPRLWLAGVIIAGLLTIPLVNLFAPVLATAFITHLYQRLAGAAGASQAGGFLAGMQKTAPVRPAGDGSV